MAYSIEPRNRDSTLDSTASHIRMWVALRQSGFDSMNPDICEAAKLHLSLSKDYGTGGNLFIIAASVAIPAGFCTVIHSTHMPYVLLLVPAEMSWLHMIISLH